MPTFVPTPEQSKYDALLVGQPDPTPVQPSCPYRGRHCRWCLLPLVPVGSDRANGSYLHDHETETEQHYHKKCYPIAKEIAKYRKRVLAQMTKETMTKAELKQVLKKAARGQRVE